MFKIKAKPAKASRGGLTPKGVRTRHALLQSARRVFEAQGYYGASVSAIVRSCGVSQGTFYQYFRNKEQVFRELVDKALARFWARAGKLDREELAWGAALQSLLELLLGHCRENAGLHRVLNEFDLIETVTISYYDSMARFLRGFFGRAAAAGEIKPLDPNVIAYSLLGTATFLQTDWGFGARDFPPERLAGLSVALLKGGISGPREWHAHEPGGLRLKGGGPESHLPWEDTCSGDNSTRRSIFRAAEQVLGQFGYSRAGISEITRRAGVAQGTFYVHFKSKEELMKGVVRFLSRELRRELRRITSQVEDRRDKEIQGMLGFLNWLRHHSQIYRIVSESEAIVPESAEYYYRKLALGYRAGLENAQKEQEIRKMPLDFMVPALMGINHMIGLRWLVWNSAPRPDIPKQVIADTVELVLTGLKTSP